MTPGEKSQSAFRGQSVNPFDRAREVYAREPCARSFEEDLWHHLQHGYVVSTPEAFAMVRVVWRDWSLEWLREPWRVDAAGDCWWIWLLAGDLRTAWRWLPEPREWIGYERKNVPRFWRCGKFMRARSNRRPFGVIGAQQREDSR